MDAARTVAADHVGEGAAPIDPDDPFVTCGLAFNDCHSRAATLKLVF